MLNSFSFSFRFNSVPFRLKASKAIKTFPRIRRTVSCLYVYRFLSICRTVSNTVGRSLRLTRRGDVAPPPGERAICSLLTYLKVASILILTQGV